MLLPISASVTALYSPPRTARSLGEERRRRGGERKGGEEKGREREKGRRERVGEKDGC